MCCALGWIAYLCSSHYFVLPSLSPSNIFVCVCVHLPFSAHPCRLSARSTSSTQSMRQWRALTLQPCRLLPYPRSCPGLPSLPVLFTAPFLFHFPLSSFSRSRSFICRLCYFLAVHICLCKVSQKKQKHEGDRESNCEEFRESNERIKKAESSEAVRQSKMCLFYRASSAVLPFCQQFLFLRLFVYMCMCVCFSQFSLPICLPDSW